MTWMKRLACALAVIAIGSSFGCSREVVPGHVRSRVAYTELDPSGTWVREGGAGETLTFTRPEGRHQFFTVRWQDASGSSLVGEALVDGTSVYATRHSGSHANDLCLYLYSRRPDGVLEALWGSHRGIAPLAYEEAHPAREPSGWDGVYAEWGNNRGGRYHDRLIIGRAIDGTAGLHRLHWTQSNHGWYRGMAFEFEDRLVGVRLPGVLVHTSSWTAGAYTVTQRQTEVGRGVLWYLGAYRLEGDALVGAEASNAQQGLAEVRWVRPSAGGEIAPVQSLEAAPPADVAPVPQNGETEAPAEAAPTEGVPADAAPADAASETAPTEDAPADAASETAPAETAPTETAPAD